MIDKVHRLSNGTTIEILRLVPRNLFDLKKWNRDYKKKDKTELPVSDYINIEPYTLKVYSENIWRLSKSNYIDTNQTCMAAALAEENFKNKTIEKYLIKDIKAKIKYETNGIFYIPLDVDGQVIDFIILSFNGIEQGKL